MNAVARSVAMFQWYSSETRQSKFVIETGEAFIQKPYGAEGPPD